MSDTFYENFYENDFLHELRFYFLLLKSPYEKRIFKTSIYFDERLGRFLPDCVAVKDNAVYWQNTYDGKLQRFKTGLQLNNQKIKLCGTDCFLTPAKVISIITVYDYVFRMGWSSFLCRGGCSFFYGVPRYWIPFYLSERDIIPLEPNRLYSKNKGAWICYALLDLCETIAEKLRREHDRRLDLEAWREGLKRQKPWAAPFTLDEFFSRYYTYEKGTRGDVKKKWAERFIAFVTADEPRLRIGKLTPEHCKAYLRNIAKYEGTGFKSLRTCKGHFSSMFNEGVKLGVIMSNPMMNVNPTKILEELEEEAKAQA